MFASLFRVFMAQIGEAVAVLVDQEGTPTSFSWREKTCLVVTRPVRYFTRSEWWIGEKASKGIGAKHIEVEVWMVTARCNSEICQFRLIHRPLRMNWSLILIPEILL
jgi:hypothetical protein